MLPGKNKYVQEQGEHRHPHGASIETQPHSVQGVGRREALPFTNAQAPLAANQGSKGGRNFGCLGNTDKSLSCTPAAAGVGFHPSRQGTPLLALGADQTSPELQMCLRVHLLRGDRSRWASSVFQGPLTTRLCLKMSLGLGLASVIT